MMKTVGIGGPIGVGHRRLLNSLCRIFEVRFEEYAFKSKTNIDAWFFPEATTDDLLFVAGADQPCYAILREEHLARCGEFPVVEFSRSLFLPPVLRGLQVRTNEAVEIRALPKWLEQITITAAKGGSPIWATRENNGVFHHIVSFPIPEMNDGQALFQIFHEDLFLRLLPFLLFLSNLTRDKHWEPPPLQACFMLDDPNLHWPTYGFVDFPKMVRHAKLHNYHVACATIPLDAWFVHRPTVSLFQEHRDYLSLLVHGNDHVGQELARSYSGNQASLVLRVALWRIGELERNTGLDVSRVMAPPHGAFSEFMLGEMARAGFEAACVSSGSLRHYNSHAEWIETVGMRPSEIISGLTIIPRFRLSAKCQNSILIAALLHQPIIPVGHHHDLSEGLDLLSKLSGFVNSLGAVQWKNMREISRSHFARKLEGRTLHVEMLTKRIAVHVPEGVNSIRIVRAWVKEPAAEPLEWRTLGENLQWTIQQPEELITVEPGRVVEIVSNPASSNLNGKDPPAGLHPWPFLRRQLSEARDRIAPLRNWFFPRQI